MAGKMAGNTIPGMSLATAALLLLPAAALAADTEGGKAAGPILPFNQGIASGLMALVVFGTALFILSTMVWPKIAGALDQRSSKILAEIAAAENARKQAKDALEEYQRNLAEAAARSQKMLEETRTQQAQLAADLRARAEAELGALRATAAAEIESAKRAAVAEIYEQSIQLASIMASRILQRDVQPADRDRLLEESLRQLQTVRN